MNKSYIAGLILIVCGIVGFSYVFLYYVLGFFTFIGYFCNAVIFFTYKMVTSFIFFILNLPVNMKVVLLSFFLIIFGLSIINESSK